MNKLKDLFHWLGFSCWKLVCLYTLKLTHHSWKRFTLSKEVRMDKEEEENSFLFLFLFLLLASNGPMHGVYILHKQP